MSNETSTETQSEDAGELLTSTVQIEALTRALRKIDASAGGADRAVYNGKSMTVEQAAGLKAVLDEFRFTVDSDGNYPDITPVVEFSKLPISINRPQLNPRAGHERFYAGVMYKYTVDEHNTELPFIMIEQALIDMRMKMTSNGTPVARYGSGWINVAIPTKAYVAICADITNVSGYTIDDSNFTKTDDEEYVTTVASISENKMPEMAMISAEEGTNEFKKYNLGNVGEAYTRQDIDDVGLGFISFHVGLNCELPIGNDSVPSDVPVRLKLKLGPSRILMAAAGHQCAYFNLSNKFDYY